MSAAAREPEPTKGPVGARASLELLAARVRRELWAPFDRERAKLVLGVLAVALVTAAHVARVGTLRFRIAAGVVLLFGTLTPLVLFVLQRRGRRDARRIVAGAATPLGRAEVARALTGLALAERIAASEAHEGVSPSLARLHVERAIARLELVPLQPIGERRGRIARWTALALLLVATIALAIAPARVVEGLDVALARHGRAPLPLAWLDDVSVVIHPPAYLHQEDDVCTRVADAWTCERTGEIRNRTLTTLPANRGAALIVHGTPRRAGRALTITDGAHEIPFVDDGSGGVVAHWSVAVSGHLRVRARFGDVVIEEPFDWDLMAIEDLPPTVVLEGAPKTIDIATAGSSIPLRYDAFDDHGLREVHLVLRIGNKEERRVLAKLDGEPKHDRGGPLLRMSDPLIQKARIPVGVRIEARDNDPITGPKWGRSAEITLVPPVVGAAEASRYEALRAQRDALVDVLAVAIDDPSAKATAAKWDEAARGLDEFLSTTFNGVRTPPRISLILKGRMRKIRDALAAEAKAEGAASHATTTQLIERLVTGLDESMRALGTRDARSIAKTLSDVATDGGDAARDLRKVEGASKDVSAEPKARLDVDVRVLDGGGSSLRRLGSLGRDLGEIVENDLRRVDRAGDAQPPDVWHAELVMRDLAARLKQPVPSFGGGSSSSSPGDPMGEDEIGDESEGEGQAGDEESQLEELAKEHGGAVSEVEDLLRDAEDPKALEGLEQEAKEHAQQLRDAVSKLPKSAGMRKTLEASESSVREKAEAMAHALDQLQIGDARERGDSALKELDEARERAWIQPGADEQLDEVQREVQKQNDWIDDILKKLRSSASAKAEAKIKAVAPHEKELEGKAKELDEQSEKKTPLPDEIKDLLEEAEKKMGEASKAFEEGDVEAGQKAQKEAQRLLEKARDQARGEDEASGGGNDGKQVDPDERLDIPKAEDHHGPEAFRKRVLEGLSSGVSSPKLQDAVKRYAEGLIQ